MAANGCPGDGIAKISTNTYLEHEIADAPVELGPVVVPLAAQAKEVLRHARHDVAVDLHVDVTLRRLKLAVALIKASRPTNSLGAKLHSSALHE